MAQSNRQTTGDTAGAVVDLTRVIDEYNRVASEQSNRMRNLTKTIGWLTAAMFLAVLVQIWLTYKALPI